MDVHKIVGDRIKQKWHPASNPYLPPLHHRLMMEPKNHGSPWCHLARPKALYMSYIFHHIYLH